MQTTSSDTLAPSKADQPLRKVRSFEIKPQGSWQQLVGWNKDCTLQQEAIKLGAEWRNRENQRDE